MVLFGKRVMNHPEVSTLRDSQQATQNAYGLTFIAYKYENHKNPHGDSRSCGKKGVRRHILVNV